MLGGSLLLFSTSSCFHCCQPRQFVISSRPTSQPQTNLLFSDDSFRPEWDPGKKPIGSVSMSCSSVAPIHRNCAVATAAAGSGSPWPQYKGHSPPPHCHPWLCFTAIKPVDIDHKEQAASKGENRILLIFISTPISQTFTCNLRVRQWSDLMGCLWSSFASNADKRTHAHKWQKHGEDFLWMSCGNVHKKSAAPVGKGSAPFLWLD